MPPVRNSPAASEHQAVAQFVDALTEPLGAGLARTVWREALSLVKPSPLRVAFDDPESDADEPRFASGCNDMPKQWRANTLAVCGGIEIEVRDFSEPGR